MSGLDPIALGVLGGLATAHGSANAAQFRETLLRAGLDPSEVDQALDALVRRGWVNYAGPQLRLTGAGAVGLLGHCAAIEAALDNSPSAPQQSECPSIPWLTTVQTEWIDAVSLNYRVDPAALSRLLPPPLEPELHRGHAWVQVLMSSLRDMRPQGLPSLFGVNFYQVSYRAAVTYRNASGELRRGGYFIRSETNDAVMRAVGNTLAEFAFHDFGGANMVMLRHGDRLTLGVEPQRPNGRLFAELATPGGLEPPSGSVWTDLEQLQGPLVECYDAYGVDREAGFLYTLTIDRDPWKARFVEPDSLYCEYFDTGPLGSVAEYDSCLHIPRCGYRWRPLRREAIDGR